MMFRNYEYFVAIAEAGSLTRRQKSYMSPSLPSASICGVWNLNLV